MINNDLKIILWRLKQNQENRGVGQKKEAYDVLRTDDN